MVLGDRVDEVAHVSDPEVAVTHLRQGSQRTDTPARIRGVESVDAAVRAIGEDDEAVVNRVGLAAVLVDAGADVGQSGAVDQREDLARLTGAPAAQERTTAALQRMPLHPVGVRTIDADLGQGDGAGSERIARDR